MATRKSKKRPADFDDEDAVLAEVAKHLDEDADDLKIEEDRGLGSFGEGTVYRISTGRGGREWLVAEDTDTAYKLAVAVVKQDLESEPEMFSKDFIESHINIDRLRRDLESDVQNSTEEDLREQSTDRFWPEAQRHGMDVPEEDEDGDMPEPDEDAITDLAERITTELLKDPMDYLSDIYGDEEAVKQAIKIAGIDEDAAAEDAVDTDGWEHFLSRYDGNSYETASRFVYWREN